MVPLFVAVSAVNLLALTLTALLGYGVSSGRPWGQYHQLAGVLSTMLCCAVHCIVFTYFIATAKWVQHAVEVKKLSDGFIEPTRSFRSQAFPASLIAMASVCVAAFIGAATFGYGLRPIYHHLAAIVALAANLFAMGIELRAIRRNGQLIDRVLAAIGPHPT